MSADKQKHILMKVEYKNCKDFMDISETNLFDEIWLVNATEFIHVRKYCAYKLAVLGNTLD